MIFPLRHQLQNRLELKLLKGVKFIWFTRIYETIVAQTPMGIFCFKPSIKHIDKKKLLLHAIIVFEIISLWTWKFFEFLNSCIKKSQDVLLKNYFSWNNLTKTNKFRLNVKTRFYKDSQFLFSIRWPNIKGKKMQHMMFGTHHEKPVKYDMLFWTERANGTSEGQSWLIVMRTDLKKRFNSLLPSSKQ